MDRLPRNFALIGAAGYIAPRHMQAIRETGNRLVAAFDPNDSVGVMDSHFPEAHFFTEFERFDRHIDKLSRRGESQVDVVSICSPNYLHDSHIRFALRSGADAICEKPLVLNPWNIDGLKETEESTGKCIYTILQLRVHPTIVALRERLMSESPSTPKHEVDLAYVTARGQWYLQSWKADEKKSGGIATNIGIHFFDVLHFLFGELQLNQVHYLGDTKAGGFLEYERARVRWFMSIDVSDVPAHLRVMRQRTFRSITLDGQEIEFSEGFVNLHTKSYEEILAGRGYGPDATRTAISAVSHIRSARPVGLVADYHPALKRAFG